VLTELHDALNAIWHVQADPNTTEENTLFSLLKERVYLFVVIFACGTLLLIALLLESWLGVLLAVLGGRLMISGPRSMHLFG
jgi:uncharacterized BrkB/YihY/UPF0761 family membrane protein